MYNLPRSNLAFTQKYGRGVALYVESLLIAFWHMFIYCLWYSRYSEYVYIYSLFYRASTAFFSKSLRFTEAVLEKDLDSKVKALQEAVEAAGYEASLKPAVARGQEHEAVLVGNSDHSAHVYRCVLFRYVLI